MNTPDAADTQIEGAADVGRPRTAAALKERPARAKASGRLGSGAALLVFGVALVGIGVIVTRFSSGHASGDGTVVVFVGPILAGIVMSIQGFFRVLGAIVSMPAAISEGRAASGAVQQAVPARRDTPGPRSADGLWWWDGAQWLAVPPASANPEGSHGVG